MELITRAELSRLAGVSKPSITEAVRNKLKPATVGKGRALKIDATHPLIVEYIANARAGNTPAGQRTPPVAPGNGAGDAPALTMPPPADDIVDFEELTIREITLRYGGAPQFKDYVKAMKDIAEYKVKEQTHRERRGDLIERDVLGAVLFHLIDAAFKRLVGELPRSLAQQLVPLVLSAGEGAAPEVEAMISEAASKILKDCKAEVTKKLNRR